MTNSQDENYLASEATEFLKKLGGSNNTFTFFDKFRFITTAGLGLIAALAWDEAIKELFHEYFPKVSPGLHSIAYALSLTIIATLVALLLGHISKRRKRNNS